MDNDLLNDIDDTLEFEEVPEDEFDSETGSDDLNTLLVSMRRQKIQREAEQQLKPNETTLSSSVEHAPPPIDDFIRNFLTKHGLMRSLDSFEHEWYELKEQGLAPPQELLDDVYARIEQLELQVSNLQGDLSRTVDIVDKTKATFNQLRKERDYHRMHHRRVVQEKNKLLNDIKRLKKYCEKYDPVLKEMKRKYEVALKDKMLMALERDKLATKHEHVSPVEKPRETKSKVKAKPKPKPSVLPVNDRPNPFVTNQPSIDPSRFVLQKTVKAHGMTISGLAIHPSRPVVATASDDMMWKLWSVPSGDLVMAGDGHKDWVGSCSFHPRGTHLATGSGDGTVRIWDFVKACCAVILPDHRQPVWDVVYHDIGDYVVSGSQDKTIRFWDINTKKSLLALRGHLDAVNSLCFLPFTNTLVSGSGDKSISIWDLRAGVSIHSLLLEQGSINHVCSNNAGSLIASSGADGAVHLWDVATMSERTDLIPSSRVPVNSSAFDPSGTFLACALEDGSIKVYNLSNGSLQGELLGHQDAVQAVKFDPEGKFLVSAGADHTFRYWA